MNTPTRCKVRKIVMNVSVKTDVESHTAAIGTSFCAF